MGSVLTHGFNIDLVIMSDDAGQFNIFWHILCWIHIERNIAKLIPCNDSQAKAIELIRTKIWELYQQLKCYKLESSPQLKESIENAFDELVSQSTCYEQLNKPLKRMKSSRDELLLVLERPELPLHNNLSEGDIREYVKRRKISGSTRSEEGRRCRDTFASLKKTAKKLNIAFWDYLLDRLTGQKSIPWLPDLLIESAMPNTS